MNNEHEIKLEQALTDLLDGASLSVVSAKYPEVASELRGYTPLFAELDQVKGHVPKIEGLQAALSAMPAVAAPVTLIPSPYLSYLNAFTVYRGAFVLPVLLLILAGAGYLIYPTAKVPAPHTDTDPTVTVLNTDTNTTLSNESIATGNKVAVSPQSDTASAKAPVQHPAPSVSMAAMNARTVSFTGDQSFDAALMPTLEMSANRSVAEDVAASAATDDTKAVSSFSTIYDEKTF